MKYFKFLIIGGIIGVALVFFIRHKEKAPIGKITLPVRASQKESAVIGRVIDGDTIALKDGRTVRFIGIDTPELHHPEVPVQFFAKEAAEFTKNVCEGFTVTLEYEGERIDSHGRTLAYIWLPDGRCVNEELIKHGYGYVYTRFPFSKMEEYLELEREARANQRGMWTHSPIDARVGGIIQRYDLLHEEGKGRFDTLLDDLIKKFPAGENAGAVR